MSNRIFVGDIGTEIICNAETDISTQTTLKIQYIKPSGATGEWDANVYNTNYAKYTTVQGDIDEAGVWKFRIYVELPSWSGYGTVDTIEVFALEW